MGLGEASLLFLHDHVLPHVDYRGRVISLGVPEIINTGADNKYLSYFTHRLEFREVLSIDVSAWESPTLVHDLNNPITDRHYRDADLVVDPGTVEHCFDTRAVLWNVVCMMKVGGIVFHVSPMNWIDHGYYNFSPVLFHDFYWANGFDEVMTYRVIDGDVQEWPKKLHCTKIPDDRRWQLFTVARKIARREQCIVPLQSLFSKKPGWKEGLPCASA